MTTRLDSSKIGRNIYSHRKRMRMTQEQLAEKVNCTMAFISRIERGGKQPSLQMLYNISTVFDTSCDALLRDPEQQGVASTADLLHVNDQLSGCPSAFVREISELIDVMKHNRNLEVTQGE